MVASQISAGEENDLRVRIYGTEGGLEWRQEEPNYLYHRPAEEPERVLKRGNDYLCEEAKKASRLPSGHPEGFIEKTVESSRGNEKWSDARWRARGRQRQTL